MKMNNTTYDLLKKICTTYAPAAVTLWLTLGSIWDLPYVQPIGATMTAIITFLGVCLGISSDNYWQGDDHLEDFEEYDDEDEE